MCDSIKSVIGERVHTNAACTCLYIHMCICQGKENRLHHVKLDLCTAFGNNAKLLMAGVGEKATVRRGLRLKCHLGSRSMLRED